MTISEENYIKVIYHLSLVSPKEWGVAGPFKKFVSAVQLLADHTWKEL